MYIYVDISLVENDNSWFVCNDTDVRKKPERFMDAPAVTISCGYSMP